MSFSKVKSYAKINLALNVTGKLKNLHKIESIVSFVDLHDLIFIKGTNKENHKISFSGKFSKNINKNNTIKKLLQILDHNELLKDKKFIIKIKKNIPQKAGLGGGSMNASTLIRFFKSKNFTLFLKKRSRGKMKNVIAM